jgi:hypothetical protein
MNNFLVNYLIPFIFVIITPFIEVIFLIWGLFEGIADGFLLARTKKLNPDGKTYTLFIPKDIFKELCKKPEMQEYIRLSGNCIALIKDYQTSCGKYIQPAGTRYVLR